MQSADFSITQFTITNDDSRPSRVSGAITSVATVAANRFVLAGVPAGVDVSTFVVEDGSVQLVSCSKFSQREPEQHFIGRAVSVTLTEKSVPALDASGRLLQASDGMHKLCLLTNDNKLQYINSGRNTSVAVTLQDTGSAVALAHLIQLEALELSMVRAPVGAIQASFNVHGWKAKAAYVFAIKPGKTVGRAQVTRRIGFMIRNKSAVPLTVGQMTYVEYKVDDPAVVEERSYSKRASMAAAPRSYPDADAQSGGDIVAERTHVSGGTAPVQINEAPVTLRAFTTTYVSHFAGASEMTFYFLSTLDANDLQSAANTRVNMAPVLKSLDGNDREKLLPFSGSLQFVLKSATQSYELHNTEYNAFTDTSKDFYMKMPNLQAVYCCVEQVQEKTTTDTRAGTRKEEYVVSYYNMTDAPVAVRQILVPYSGYSFDIVTLLTVTSHNFTVGRENLKERADEMQSNSRMLLHGFVQPNKTGVSAKFSLMISYKTLG